MYRLYLCQRTPHTQAHTHTRVYICAERIARLPSSDALWCGVCAWCWPPAVKWPARESRAYANTHTLHSQTHTCAHLNASTRPTSRSNSVHSTHTYFCVETVGSCFYCFPRSWYFCARASRNSARAVGFKLVPYITSTQLLHFARVFFAVHNQMQQHTSAGVK